MEAWRKMQALGVTAFRLNTSHLEIEQVVNWLERLSSASDIFKLQLPIILDLQGSKWRIGQIDDLTLKVGQEIELFFGHTSQNATQIPVPHPDFFRAAFQSTEQIALNDAKVLLSRKAFGPDWLKARVSRGGDLSARKGITYLDSDFRNENLTEKDQKIVISTQGYSNIQYALSYVRDSKEMAHYREVFGMGTTIIAKIERQPALNDVHRISQTANALWLCRGDLGAELGLPEMARAVSHFTKELDKIPHPVLMAGQVLEHMSSYPQPTRSEVCHLLDCLENGYSGFVLSDETAIGKYPLESCEIASRFK